MKKSKTQKSVGGNGAGRANGGHEFLTVGIGASAGGIQALKEFFENVPADSGVAYVVILHLSPDHDSRLAEVLQTAAQIPVTQVKERVKVEPDHVYVVPPNQHLGMYDGHIIVEQNVSVEERRAPVDIFFRTLAESRHERAIGVILSGTGADGSMGIKRVKERGGAAFVQNPREAEFSEMPRNSIATELIDAVLNVREIPAKIIAYKENLGTVEIPLERESRPEEETAALREIFTVLRVRTGHDFSNYKRPTVLRRIERRINVCELESLPAYAAFIKENPDEAQSLLKDLLISVTNFFRDKEAFEFLERDVVPRIVQDKTSQDQIRVWVAGCATGEEAYSLAMLFAEQTETSPVAPAIQIFATDIDEAAIAAAREGFYTLNDAADISPERLRRFFTKEGDGFRVRRELREMILFANHNLLKDAPFSHLDLVTCRNLLIYFNDTAQERAMETFHFALNPGSFLLLGTSESVDGAGDLYAAVSKDHHIYQSRQAAARIAYPVPDAPPAMRYVEPKTSSAANAAGTSQGQEHRPLERISFGDLHQQLLEQYAPPSIVVNENHDIVHLSERAGRFLQVAGGELSKNLLHLIRPELRLELRTALFQAVQRRANVVAANLKVQTNGHAETVNIQVRPVLREEDTARGFLLVLFEPSGEDAAEASERVLASDEPVARRLEEELERTKAQLRMSVEQYEIQTEELRASNEELQAMNEELRSTAEELETSREELQSVNEELMTVNQELKIKIEEISISNNDFKNLLNSTDIGTIFLDRSLRVKMFTPSVREVFNLIDADINRPLADITTKLNFDDLHTDVERVLETLQTVEREFVTAAGKWYLLRVFPYRTSEDKINGAVVTLFDITGRKAAEDAVRESREKYRTLFDSIDEGFCIFEVIFDARGKAIDYRFLEVNQAFERQTGVTRAQGKRMLELAPAHEPEWAEMFGEIVRTGESVRTEYRAAALDRWFDFYALRVGEPGENRVAAVFQDVTTRKRAAANQAFLADIADDMSRLSTVDEIMETTGAKIGAYLAVKSCLFVDVDDARGEVTVFHAWNTTDVPSLRHQTIRLADFINEEFARAHRAGEVIIVRDTHTDPRGEGGDYTALGLGAFVTIPFHSNGVWTNYLAITDSQPRDWRDDEIELFRELSNRVFPRLERARAEEALRESEAKYRALFNSIDEGYYLLEVIFDENGEATDVLYLDANPAAISMSGEDRRGKRLREVGNYEPYWYELYGRVARTGVSERLEQFSRTAGMWVDTFTFKVEGAENRVALVFQDITARKQNEEALRESEARIAADLAGMQRLYELQSKLTDQNDVEAAFQDILAVACDFTGTDRGCVQFLSDDGERLEMFVWQGYADDSPFISFFRYEGLEVGCEVARVQRQRLIIEDTEGFAGLEGTDAAVAVRADKIRASQSTPMTSRAGHTIGVISTQFRQPHRPSDHELRLMDMLAWTAAEFLERHRADTALRKAHERLQVAMNTGRIFSWEMNPATRELEWSENMESVIGFPLLDNIDKTFALIHPDDIKPTVDAINEALENGGVCESEYRLVNPANGEAFWFHSQGAVTSETADRQPRFVGITQNITERKRAEEALRESEERLRLIMESIKDFAIITIDTDGIITGWHPGAEKAFGWTAQEIIGRSTDLTFTHEDRERGIPAQERKTARERGSAADERWHVRKDGARFYVSGVMSPVRHGGELTGYVKIARDLTEQRRAEEALHRAHEELEDRVRERTLELAETNVSLQAEIVERRASQAARVELLRQLVRTQEDERRRIAREMHDQFGQQLTALILKLGMLKAECGAQKELCDQLEALEMVARQLDEDVDFFVWELRPTALDDLGLQLALTNYAQNWSKHFGVPVEVHENGMNKHRLNFEIETAFYRIAQEALNNIAKHAGATSVSILLERRAGSVSLIVEDDGCGFDEENTSVSGDRGLGLAGMRERAALLGGSVEIESATGEGTTIIARIPTSHATAARARDEKGADE
jgi:PAS domain S-box-containing protein